MTASFKAPCGPVDTLRVKASATARDYGWLSLAVVVALLTVLNVIACAVALVRGTSNLAGLVRLPVSLLFGYWMSVGAWRRTRWGLVIVDATQMTPALDATQTRRLIVIGALCCMALTFALAMQVVQGRT